MGASKNSDSPGIEALYGIIVLLLGPQKRGLSTETGTGVLSLSFHSKMAKAKNPIAVHNQRKSLPNASFVSHTKSGSEMAAKLSWEREEDRDWVSWRGPTLYCHFHGSVERFHLRSGRWYPLAVHWIVSFPWPASNQAEKDSLLPFGDFTGLMLFVCPLSFLVCSCCVPRTSPKKPDTGGWASALFVVAAMSSSSPKSSWVLCPARIVLFV